MMNVTASMFVRINTFLIDHINCNQLMRDSQRLFFFFFSFISLSNLFLIDPLNASMFVRINTFLIDPLNGNQLYILQFKLQAESCIGFHENIN